MNNITEEKKGSLLIIAGRKTSENFTLPNSDNHLLCTGILDKSPSIFAKSLTLI